MLPSEEATRQAYQRRQLALLAAVHRQASLRDHPSHLKPAAHLDSLNLAPLSPMHCSFPMQTCYPQAPHACSLPPGACSLPSQCCSLAPHACALPPQFCSPPSAVCSLPFHASPVAREPLAYVSDTHPSLVASPAEADWAGSLLPSLSPRLRQALFSLGLEQMEIALRRANVMSEEMLSRYTPSSLRLQLELHGDRIPLHVMKRIFDVASAGASSWPSKPPRIPPSSPSQPRSTRPLYPLRASPPAPAHVTSTPAEADRLSTLLPSLSPQLKRRLADQGLEQVDIALRRAGIFHDAHLTAYSPSELSSELARQGDMLPLRYAISLIDNPLTTRASSAPPLCHLVTRATMAAC